MIKTRRNRNNFREYKRWGNAGVATISAVEVTEPAGNASFRILVVAPLMVGFILIGLFAYGLAYLIRMKFGAPLGGTWLVLFTLGAPGPCWIAYNQARELFLRRHYEELAEPGLETEPEPMQEAVQYIRDVRLPATTVDDNKPLAVVGPCLIDAWLDPWDLKTFVLGCDLYGHGRDAWRKKHLKTGQCSDTMHTKMVDFLMSRGHWETNGAHTKAGGKLSGDPGAVVAALGLDDMIQHNMAIVGHYST